MTTRHTVDSLTSNELDQLYARADRAEAAIERVRNLATRLEEFAENALKTADRQLYAALASDLRTAIDQAQQPTTTEAAPAGCTCHNGDERCSGCGACPDICNGCR